MYMPMRAHDVHRAIGKGKVHGVMEESNMYLATQAGDVVEACRDNNATQTTNKDVA